MIGHAVVTLWATTILLSAAASPAAAQANAESERGTNNDNGESEKKKRALFEQAVALFSDGEFEEASKFFRKAYEIDRDPKLLFNIGQSEISAKRYGLALEAFQKYLKTNKEQIHAEREAQLYKDIDLLQKMVGKLSVKAAPGCTVLVDDVERGATPLIEELFLAAEKVHRLVIKCRDNYAYSKRFTLTVGETVQVNAQRETEKALSEVAAEPEPKPQITDQTPDAAQTATRDDELEKRLLHRRATDNMLRDLSLGAVVVGGVGGVTGGLLAVFGDSGSDMRAYGIAIAGASGLPLVLSLVSYSVYLSRAKETRKLATKAELNLDDEILLLDRSLRNKTIITWATFLSGVAVGAAGGVLLGVGFSADSEPLRHLGTGALVGSGFLLTTSATAFVTYGVDKKQRRRLAEKNSGKERSALFTPGLTPVPGGALLGAEGRF